MILCNVSGHCWENVGRMLGYFGRNTDGNMYEIIRKEQLSDAIVKMEVKAERVAKSCLAPR